MPVYSIIKKSELEGALRLDAEYYQPEYLNITKKLRNNKFFRKFSEITDGGNYGVLPDSIDYITDGSSEEFIYLIRGIDMRGLYINKDDLIKVPKRYFNPKAETREGDLLFLVKGATIDSEDSVAITPKLPRTAIFNGSVYRSRLKSDVLPEYAYLFMRTKYFYTQKRRMVSNIGIEYNSQSEIKNYDFFIPPINFQNEIKGDIQQTFSLLNQSKNYYSQAEQTLLKELGLENFKEEDALFSIVKLLDIKKFRRVDAEYFQPKYEKLISKIKSQKAGLLANVIENVSAQFNPQSQPEESFQYVELSNINSSIGVIDGFSEVLGKEAPSRAKRVLKDGDVIVSTVEGSLSKVALVDERQDGFLASTGFFQFRSKKILPEVLLMTAKSIIFQMQLEKLCAGTILTAVPKEAIKSLIVPILPQQTQQKIADLVQKSHQARQKAQELLAQAKQKVENLIENPTK